MNNHTCFIAYNVLIAIVFFVVGHNIDKSNQYEQAQKAADTKMIAEFFHFKDELESCQNETKDHSIKTESFSLLLEHVISQSVPRERMIKAIQKCKSSLV